MKPVEEGHRYLFVIEVSKNMDRYQESVLETVLDLVETGMHGDMQTGDAFTLWLYRDRVGANLFQPEVWFSDTRQQHAQAAGEFVSQLKYADKADLNLAMDEVMKVVAASKSVTIFLINEGSLGMTGTPFDLYANTFYREQTSEYRKLKKPFVTAFLAADGKILDCVISPGGTQVKVPKIPDSLRHQPEYAKPVAATSNAPAAVTAPKNKTAPTPQPKRPVPAPKTTPSTKPRSDIEPVTPPPVQMSLGTIAPREVPYATPRSTATSQVAMISETPHAESEPTAFTSGSPSPSHPPAAPGVVTRHAVPKHWLIFIGSGFLLCAAWITWLIIRTFRPARGPSLITRSLEESHAESTP